MNNQDRKNSQDRKTLKNYFSNGALPTAQHYSDLVDSMVTWKDDGLDKDWQNGWRISSAGDQRSLMSFYAGVGASEPVWILRNGTTEGNLELQPVPPGGAAAPSPGTAPPVGLVMTRAGQLGVNVANPDWRLDVDGTVRMRGRLGYARPGLEATVPADGIWHDITDPMEGCHAIEVMAGVGGQPGMGHYAMLHAVAMNAYNPRNPLLNWLFNRRSIRSQSAVYGVYSDRLRLRWESVGKDAQAENASARRAGKRTPSRFNRPYKLRIKTSANFGPGAKIRYYITHLWFDSQMQGSRSGIDRDQGAM